MEKRHEERLRVLLQAFGANAWEIQGIEGRCEGWWPSLTVFVAERLSEGHWPVPADEETQERVGQAWIDEERFSLIEDEDGEEPGVFVIRGSGW
jgi:hypothetical protein